MRRLLAFNNRLLSSLTPTNQPTNQQPTQSTASSAGPSAPKRFGGTKPGAPLTGSEFTPVELRTPQLSTPCLAALCSAVTEDGLVQQPAGGWGGAGSGLDRSGSGSVLGTPSASAGGVLTGLGGGTGRGGAMGEHVRLVRGDRFRAFVLSAATNVLDATQRDAASAVLLGGCGSGVGGSNNSWLVLCGPLYKLSKVRGGGWLMRGRWQVAHALKKSADSSSSTHRPTNLSSQHTR